MASFLMHAATGATIARVTGFDRRGMIYAGLLAASPDVDLLVGLAVRGDADAYHRVIWSHSPVTAVIALVALTAFWLAVDAFRTQRRHRRYRRALKLGVLGSVAVLTHPLMDYWLVNPLFIDPHELSGRERNEAYVINFFTDLLFYGGILLLVLAAARFISRRLSAYRRLLRSY